MIESQFTSPSVLDSEMELRSASAKTGLRFLMAAISSMFFLFFISYIMRSQISDWEALAQLPEKHSKAGLGGRRPGSAVVSNLPCIGHWLQIDAYARRGWPSPASASG